MSEKRAPTGANEDAGSGPKAAQPVDNREYWEDAPGLWDEAKDYFFTWLRKVWKLRGGGLYAVGWAIAFLYLEITDILFDDIPTILAMESYGPGPMLGVFIAFVVDTLINTGLAFIWPALMIGWQQPWGILLLLVAVLVFPRHVKPHISAWLDIEEPTDEPEAESESAAS